MTKSADTSTAATPDFNPLAHIYQWMELASFGPWLQWCRCTFLGEVTDRRHALIIGDGDGRFTARLLQTNHQIQIDAVDASSAMLDELRRRAGQNAHRVRTWNMDARNWRPGDSQYDLVVTHFFLDCLTTTEIEALAATISTAVTPSAKWIISEFAVPAGSYGRLVARPLIRSLYWAFGRLTGLKMRALPDYRGALLRSEFEFVAERKRLGGLLTSELWSFPSSSQKH